MGAQHGFAVGLLAGLELSKELGCESFDFVVGRLRPRSIIWKVPRHRSFLLRTVRVPWPEDVIGRRSIKPGVSS
jgi:hypothetical protein